MVLSPIRRGVDQIGANEHLFNLQPAENDVQIGGVIHIAPFSCMLFHRPKPSEKEKEIPWPYAQSVQMSLSHGTLAEARAPASCAWIVVFAKVRIEMKTVATDQFSACEIRHHLAHINAGSGNITEMRRTCAVIIRNGEVTYPPIGQDGTGNAPVDGVKSLAAKDEFHMPAPAIRNGNLCVAIRFRREFPDYRDPWDA